jgi:hypothetical protein
MIPFTRNDCIISPGLLAVLSLQFQDTTEPIVSLMMIFGNKTAAYYGFVAHGKMFFANPIGGRYHNVVSNKQDERLQRCYHFLEKVMLLCNRYCLDKTCCYVIDTVLTVVNW